MSVEELAKLVIDFMEFHGMDSEFYLPDPCDPNELCYIFQEDLEYSMYSCQVFLRPWI